MKLPLSFIEKLLPTEKIDSALFTLLAIIR